MALNIPIANQSNFYSQKLSGEYLQLYNSCVNNLTRGVLTTSMSLSRVDDLQNKTQSVVEAVLYGCPELFYVDQQVQIKYSGQEVILNFTNKYNGENLSQLWNELDSKINQIVEIIKNGNDFYERLNLLNYYFCANVESSTSIEGKVGDPYGALILRKARCEGFAKATKMILDRLGINSIIALGHADNGTMADNHAWNIVENDMIFYHFDFAWNASKTAYGIPSQEYMFLDDKEAYIEHFPKYIYPTCGDASNTFWARNRGFVEYQSDFSRINIVPFGNNYMAIAKMANKLTESEIREDVFNWLVDELAGYNFGSQLSYAYNEHLNLLIFYFINQE